MSLVGSTAKAAARGSVGVGLDSPPPRWPTAPGGGWSAGPPLPSGRAGWSHRCSGEAEWCPVGPCP
eukprot:8403147-Alexandrium_andersonii.AAC.1